MVKPNFRQLVIDNPHISKVYAYAESESLSKELKSENYSAIVDLQKNRKSISLRKKLKTTVYSFNKLNIKKWLLVQTGINLLPEKKHIVHRYFDGICHLQIKDDLRGCEFYVNDSVRITGFDLPNDYIILAAGAAHEGKRLFQSQIEDLVKLSSLPIVLLGDSQDKERLQSLDQNSRLINLCGRTTIQQLGLVIKESSGVISGDTGIMHIASCFEIPQVSIWGCTRPVLGMWPYLKKNQKIITADSKRPCSKLGDKCKSHPELCIKKHSAQNIMNALSLLSKE